MSNSINEVNKIDVNCPKTNIAKVAGKTINSPIMSLNENITNLDIDLDSFVDNAKNVIEDVGKQLEGAKDAVGNFVGNTVDFVGKNVSEILNFNDEVEEENNVVYNNKDGNNAYDIRDEQGNKVKTITTPGDIQINENGNIIVTEKYKYNDSVSKQIIYDSNGDVLTETEYNPKNGRILKKTEKLSDNTTRITTDLHNEKFGFENYGYLEEIYDNNVIMSGIQYDFAGNPLTTTEYTYPSEGSRIIRTYDENSNLKLESEESDGVNIARRFNDGQIAYEEKKYDNGNSEVTEYNQNGQVVRSERQWIDNGRKYGILREPQTDENGVTKISDNAMYISSSGGISGYNLLSAEDKAYYDSL